MIYLVGAGPGDPGLLTLRGAEVIGRADVVMYDALVSPRIVDLAPPTAERIYVGKRGPGAEDTPWSSRTVPQSETTALLVRLGRTGKTVIRLKGGDPFVFGRGGEEADALAEAGVPFEVVPGVTSAVAAPAYAGIPVTHRDATSTLAIVTGHEDPAKDTSAIDWAALSRMGTVVFVMGMTHLDENLRRLVAAGRDPATPAAAIEWGTLPRQRVVFATLGDLAARAAEAGLGAPAVVVVGDVCRRAQGKTGLDWFGRRPLRGRTVVVTRTRRQASALVRALEERGAEAVEFPVIEVRPVDPAPALAALGRPWDWIVFTSANGVEAVAGALDGAGLDARAFGAARLAAIGPATAGALRARLGLRADLVPAEYLAEALVASLGDVRGRRILLLRAAVARDVLPEGLRAAGAEVDVVPVYETVAAAADGAALRARIEAGEIDAVTFTSSSTVERFVEAVPGAAGLLRARGVAVASIGPVTSAAARRLGLDVSVEAEVHDVGGLVEALTRFLVPR